jgi:two-component system, sensor histidine kinase and response regulator
MAMSQSSLHIPSGAFNLGEAVNRCFGSRDVFQDMVECFFDEADPLLEQMRAAVSAGDTEGLGRAAHRLKGTVGYLAAPSAMDATRRVEKLGRSGDLAGAAEAIEQLAAEVRILAAAVASYRKS